MVVKSHIRFKLFWSQYIKISVGVFSTRLDMDSRITEPDPRCEEQVRLRHGSHQQRPGAEVHGDTEGKPADGSTPGGGA